MKKFYTISFLFFCLLQTGFRLIGKAQCVNGNMPTTVLMDTTIYFETGVTSTNIKFPKFDPETGMLNCVKLTTTMMGAIDTVSLQNLSNNTQTAKFTYVRSDQMRGPGLRTPLANDISKQYGPFTVTKFDGNFGVGTDHISIPRDTVLQKTVVRSLTDSSEISQFYGKDSVDYSYKIDVSTLASITGGNSSNLVLTSAMARFRFEYCACAKVVLPVDLKNFSVSKTGAQSASLRWEGENDAYLYGYDIEVSTDGRQFTTMATIERQYTATPVYRYSFTSPNNESGKYYFRIRQRWQNGYVRFTEIKTVEFTNPVFASVSLYPNPSNGNAGIKFVNGKAGRVLVQVTGTGGQPVLSKEMQVAETDYKSIGTLPVGVYWVKITDMATKTSCVKQLIVR